MLKRSVSAFALAFVTAGCGANISGTVGISVTGSGDVLAIAKGCGEKFDGAILYKNTRDDNLTDVARWDLAPGVSGSETFVWQITGGARDIRFAKAPALSKGSFGQSTHYTLRAGTTDPNTVIGDGDLTGADLTSLRPGSVLIADLANWDTDKQDYAPTMIVSRKKFDEIACSHEYQNTGS